MAAAAAAAGAAQDQSSLRMMYRHEIASDYVLTPEQVAAAEAEAAAAVGGDTRALRDTLNVGGGFPTINSSYPIISAAGVAAGDAAGYCAADQQQMHFPLVQQHSMPLVPPPPAAMPTHGHSAADAPQKPMGMLNPANWFAKKQASPPGPRPSPLQVNNCTYCQPLLPANPARFGSAINSPNCVDLPLC
jgi:hypothetical protein